LGLKCLNLNVCEVCECCSLILRIRLFLEGDQDLLIDLCASQILLYAQVVSILGGSSYSLKLMMSIQVRLVQLLNVEEASSLQRRHLARDMRSDDGILHGYSSCLG